MKATPSSAAAGGSAPLQSVTAVPAPAVPFTGEAYPLPSGPLTAVTKRSTGSLALRLYQTAATKGLTCDPYTGSCVPAWCQPTGQVVVELSTEAIAIRESAAAIGAPPNGHLSLLLATGEGTYEGAPVQLAAARTSADVDHVVLKTAGGSDSMKPVDDLVALAVTGPDATGTLTAYDSAGRTLAVQELPADPTQTQPVCATQPMRLPQPGIQPADRTAAEQQVRAAFVDAFTHDDASADWYTGLRSVQNGAALHDAVAQVHKNFPEAANTITVTTGDLVFTNPTTAYVRYTTSYTGGASYGEQNGSAVLDHGKWLVTESTFCGLLRFGAATCP